MKKAIILLCVVAGILSCTKEPVGPEAPAAGTPMTFEISVAETKADKTAWANGDKIYVFFKGIETKYLVLTYSTGTGWANASGGSELTSGDFSGLETKTLTAVHFPVPVDVTYAGSKFSFTKDGKPFYNYYLLQTNKEYSVSGTTVTATLSMSNTQPDLVLFHVAGIQANVADYTFGCSKIRPVACVGVGTDGMVHEDTLQPGARLSGIADDDGVIFAGRTEYPGSAVAYTFTLASDTQICALTRASRTLTAGNMYNFPAPTSDGGWTVQSVSDLYVDLDITVGGKKIYWAKCNLGAASETDYGDYFAWGETTGYNEGKTNFDWSTYTWGKASDALTKYCNYSDFGKDGFTDPLTTLLPEDDAAYSALGGKFRMPTSAEISALVATKTDTDNYTWTWCDGSTTKYNDSTISGWKIVRNSTSSTLFLPAAGCRDGADLIIIGPDGANVDYWSSSLFLDGPPCAYHLSCTPVAVDRGYAFRLYGFSVRPVFSE